MAMIGAMAMAAMVVGAAPTKKKPPPAYPWNIWVDYGLLVDGRDKKTYKSIDVDTLQWMSQNLDFTTDSSWCYDRDSSNCAIYGRHYKPSEAMSVCPKGWRLPTAAEWVTLFHAAGDGHAFSRLSTTRGWSLPPTNRLQKMLAKYVKPIPSPTARLLAKTRKTPPLPPPVEVDPDPDDRLGFRILPAGLRVEPMVHHDVPTAGNGEAAFVESAQQKAHPTVSLEFGLRGYAAYFWAATPIDTVIPIDSDGQPGLEIHGTDAFDQFGFSVRCVKPNRSPVVPAEPSRGAPRRGW